MTAGGIKASPPTRSSLALTWQICCYDVGHNTHTTIIAEY
jgi:hypothetical protein